MICTVWGVMMSDVIDLPAIRERCERELEGCDLTAPCSLCDRERAILALVKWAGEAVEEIEAHKVFVIGLVKGKMREGVLKRIDALLKQVKR